MTAYKKQTGVALITAMLVVSLAAILASALVSQLFLDIRRTANIFQSEQAYLYNLKAESFAMFFLLEEEKNPDSQGFDDLEYYSSTTPPIVSPVPGGKITGRLEDLQGRFNLNNLSPLNSANHAREVKKFRALLTALAINNNLHNELIDSLIDWIDDNNPPNSQTLPYGAEYDYYTGLDKPYRPANNLMLNATELRMVKGFNNIPENFNVTIYEILKNHICALPDFNLNININTASVEVLQTIKNIDKKMAEQIVENERPFKNQKDFVDLINSLSSPPTNHKSIPGTQVNSEYFLLTSISQTGENRVTMYSTIYRPANPGNTPDDRMHIIRRSLGKGTQ